MRQSFTKSLVDLAGKDPRIILLTVDVGYGVLEPFVEKYPDRFIDSGISEANTIGVATGMALKGKIPFVYSINSFLLFKGLEQIRMLADMGPQVVLVGVGKDREYTNFGLTHYSFGDEAILATIPIKVLTPEKKSDVEMIVDEAYNNHGPSYIRLSRF